MKSEKNEANGRFEGANWDEPVVKVNRHGKTGVIDRKVLTKGVKRLYLAPLVRAIKDALRQGMEVRFMDEKDAEVLRIFPIASKDCRSMYPVAQMMKTAKSWLSDKKLRVSHAGHEIGEAGVKALVREAARRREQSKVLCVTPDTMVKCPNCGTRFRVGKVLADSKEAA